jgi:hypothetical protein
MTQIVIADRRYSNWNRGQNQPGSWRVIWEYQGKDIPDNIPLTQKAIDHWKKFKINFGNTATFRGDKIGQVLNEDDLRSIISACKRAEATIYINRIGQVSGYKLKGDFS